MAITRIPRLDTNVGDYFSEGLGQGLDNTLEGLKGYLGGKQQEKLFEKKIARLKQEKTKEEKKEAAKRKRESGAFAEWMRQNDYSDEQVESLRYAPLKLAAAIMQGEEINIAPAGRKKKQNKIQQALANPIPNIGQQLTGQQLPQFQYPQEQQQQMPQFQEQQGQMQASQQQEQMQQQQMQQMEEQQRQQQMQGILQQQRPIVSEAPQMSIQPSGMEQPIPQQMQQAQGMSSLPPQVGQTQQMSQAPQDLPVEKVLQARLDIQKQLRSKQVSPEQVKQNLDKFGIDPQTQEKLLGNTLTTDLIQHFLQKSGNNKKKAIAMAKKYGFGGR